MWQGMSPLLMLGIAVMAVLVAAMLYVLARVLWLELFMGGSGKDTEA
jgi:hypothetical protein